MTSTPRSVRRPPRVLPPRPPRGRGGQVEHGTPAAVGALGPSGAIGPIVSIIPTGAILPNIPNIPNIPIGAVDAVGASGAFGAVSTPRAPGPKGKWSTLAAAAVLAALAAGLAGCAGSPPTRLHSLVSPERAAEPAAVASPAAPTRPVRVVVGPVAVPAALDQPQWLVREPDDSLRMLEQDRWAGPLGEEFRAALRDALRLRWAANDALPASGGAPAWRVTVDVSRLDARPAVDSLLEARWVVQSPQAAVATGVGGALPPAALSASCATRVREPVQGPGTAALAAAHRRAVLRLADDIGRQLQAMAAGAGAACVAAPVA